MQVISDFIQTRFRSSLRPLRLRDEQIAIISGDVAARLQASLAHWHTPEMRDPLHELARELAAFYEPRSASWGARLLTATAVRNSVIEDIGADHPTNPALRIPNSGRTDKYMPDITGAAIRYFDAQPLDELAREAVAPAADPFAHLPERFPRAWHALTALARMEGTEQAITLPAAPPVLIPAPAATGNGRPLGGADVRVTESGFNPGFHPELVKILRAIQADQVDVFFVDSFKELSRLPDKVCHVIEIVLSLGHECVTANYYIGPRAVARRAELLRPAHTMGDMTKKLILSPVGGSKRHTEALSNLARQRLGGGR